MTISPIRRGTEKINGAICLLTDLTELAALQQQIQLKESLAAVGELSAGIAHEFKNALATISGYAQMISAEAGVGEVADSAERILEQTRNITHVVTEFLKYARPLEISERAGGAATGWWTEWCPKWRRPCRRCVSGLKDRWAT